MPNADLSVTKTASPAIANIGEEINYTITVRNNGPDNATNVVLTDTVPAGSCLVSISISPEQGSYTYSGSVVRWAVGDLTAQASVILKVSVIANTAGSLTNVATVTSDDDDNPNNDSATATVVVTGTLELEADLAISKISCPRALVTGEIVTYQLRVFNNGPSASEDVTVTDTVPPGLEVLSANSDRGVCSINGQHVTCELGTLAANERANIIIEALSSAPGTFMNTATVAGSTPDPNVTNNTDSAFTTVQPAAFVTIKKTASPETVILGGTLTYTITVQNTGSSDATGVTVTEILPASVDVLAINCSQGSACCTPIALNKYLCQLGTLPANGAAVITITVKPREPGCITNTAILETTSLNLNPCTTVSTSTSVRRPVADLAVTKSHSPSYVAICTPITYTLTVTNNGPYPATGIVLADNLPSSVQVLSICASQGHCSRHCHNEVVCHLCTLPVGGNAVVHITAKPCQLGKITNTAIVTANEDDLYPENNQTEHSLTVLTLSELIQILIDKITELAASGEISQENAELLLSKLCPAENAVKCGNYLTAANYLNSFIDQINCFIREGILSTETGCSLIKIAETILDCLCCHEERGVASDE